MYARRVVAMLFLAVGVGMSVVATPAGVEAANKAKVKPKAEDPATTKIDPANAPFRAKLVENAVLAQRAAGTFSSAAKQPAPPKMTNDQKKLFAEHTKWLADNAARFNALHSQMDLVLAKGGRAPATELAQTNMQFLTLCEAIEAESRRFNELAAAARNRHAVAMSAIRNQK